MVMWYFKDFTLLMPVSVFKKKKLQNNTSKVARQSNLLIQPFDYERWLPFCEEFCQINKNVIGKQDKLLLMVF